MNEHNTIRNMPLGKIYQGMIKPMDERFLGSRIFTQSQSITLQVTYYYYANNKSQTNKQTEKDVTSKTGGTWEYHLNQVIKPTVAEKINHIRLCTSDMMQCDVYNIT